MRFVEAEKLARGFGAIAKSVPDLALGIAVAAKKNRARRLARHHREQRLRLVEAGEVVEVAIEAVRVVAVAVAHALGRRGDECHAFAHQGGEACAARRKDGNGVTGFHLVTTVASPARPTAPRYRRPATVRRIARR